MLEKGNNVLSELGLKWNKLNSLSGNKIALALEKNETLKVLDLSMNKIGQKPCELRPHYDPKKMAVKPMKDGEIGTAWGIGLGANKSLVHIDLSYN